MKRNLFLLLLLFSAFQLLAQSPVISNKHFSFGSYGRAGIAYGVGIEGQFPRSLNLNGMGSIGGRFEEFRRERLL
jgi:maltoporin